MARSDFDDAAQALFREAVVEAAGGGDVEVEITGITEVDTARRARRAAGLQIAWQLSALSSAGIDQASCAARPSPPPPPPPPPPAAAAPWTARACVRRDTGGARRRERLTLNTLTAALTSRQFPVPSKLTAPDAPTPAPPSAAEPTPANDEAMRQLALYIGTAPPSRTQRTRMSPELSASRAGLGAAGAALLAVIAMCATWLLRRKRASQATIVLPGLIGVSAARARSGQQPAPTAPQPVASEPEAVAWSSPGNGV
jgi:hypothetical protein